jgi:hypothetical protein
MNTHIAKPKKLTKLKRSVTITTLAVLWVLGPSAFAGINTGEGGHMMHGGWGTGLGWALILIAMVAVILGSVYRWKRKR